jgi:thiol-disulfide isomerase/thioredoxin
MVKKIVLGVGSVFAVLAVAGYVLYASNATPTVAPISAADMATADRPWVVKLHARWCPVCMLTKGVWSQIEQTYAERAHLVVFDFTNRATTDASRAEAERLGLAQFFETSGFATGPIAVLDGRTKKVRAWINGSRDFADYSTAIEAAL